MKKFNFKRALAGVMATVTAAGFMIMPVSAALSTSGSTEVNARKCSFTLAVVPSSNSAYVFCTIAENPLAVNLKIAATLYATYKVFDGKETSMVTFEKQQTDSNSGMRFDIKNEGGTVYSAKANVKFTVDGESSANIPVGPVYAR